MKKEEEKRKRTILCDDLDASRNPSILACVCLSLSLSLPPSLSHFVIILFIYVLWGQAPCLLACLSVCVSSPHVLVILITHLMCCLPRHQQTRFICKDIKKMRDLCTRPAWRMRNIFWVKQNKTLTRFFLPKMGPKAL